MKEDHPQITSAKISTATPHPIAHRLTKETKTETIPFAWASLEWARRVHRLSKRSAVPNKLWLDYHYLNRNAPAGGKPIFGGGISGPDFKKWKDRSGPLLIICSFAMVQSAPYDGTWICPLMKDPFARDMLILPIELRIPRIDMNNWGRLRRVNSELNAFGSHWCTQPVRYKSVSAQKPSTRRKQE
jgi:hypothetical protein